MWIGEKSQAKASTRSVEFTGISESSIDSVNHARTACGEKVGPNARSSSGGGLESKIQFIQGIDQKIQLVFRLGLAIGLPLFQLIINPNGIAASE